APPGGLRVKVTARSPLKRSSEFRNYVKRSPASRHYICEALPRRTCKQSRKEKRMPGPRKLPDFKTEHFKFYRVEINQDPRNIPATLRGQFEKAGEQRRHRVVLLTFFGNPVRKNQEPFRNKVTHLDWYKLAGAHEPNRTAGVINQFGKDVLVLGD